MSGQITTVIASEAWQSIFLATGTKDGLPRFARNDEASHGAERAA